MQPPVATNLQQTINIEYSLFAYNRLYVECLSHYTAKNLMHVRNTFGGGEVAVAQNSDSASV